MVREQKLREIEQLLARVRQLESELADSYQTDKWPPPYYTTHHILAGCVFGVFGAAVSLIFNIVGALLLGKHPLELIRVYLTFPLGEQAFNGPQNDVALAIGCCLYLATGMLLGIPIHLVLSKYCSNESFASRFAVTTALSLGLWVFNFYGVLSWLQPALFGGNWIVEKIPWWVAALTHLVFGWTILLCQPLGAYSRYQLPASEAA
jgi:hypothetical protein